MSPTRLERAMSAYTLNQEPVSHATFVSVALDPAQSVTVEACAGSGKTWLLVGRMLRLLLAGAEPSSILAITFTRKAAQEMQARLLTLLEQLAGAPAAQALTLLEQRGLQPAQAHALLTRARTLYDLVLQAQPSLKVQTFHGWFWEVLRRAPWRLEPPDLPRQAGRASVNQWGRPRWPQPQAGLLEQTERLQEEAWHDFLAHANRDLSLQAHYLTLLQFVTQPRDLLASLFHQRAEWWAFAAAQEAQGREPIEAALAIWADMPNQDPRLDWQQPPLQAACQAIIESVPAHPELNGSVRDLLQRCQDCLATITPAGLPEVSVLGAYRHFFAAVLTQKGQIQKNLINQKQLGLIGARQASYVQALESLAAHYHALEANYEDWQACRLNQAAWPCALAWLEAYQQRKAARQVLDFTDIEWHTRELLQDDRYAAYMQMRLDARYQHLLFDEFQDTNPFQWGIIQSWLAGYGRDGERPSVFIVGDPKQSIYRFRRADSRLFASAGAWLQQYFQAQALRTNHTWRNATAIIETVNSLFLALPEAMRPQDFAPQTTQAQQQNLPQPEGTDSTTAMLSGVYCYPLADSEPAPPGLAEAVIEPVASTTLPQFRNPLLLPATDVPDERRVQEATALASLIQGLLPTLTVTTALGERRPANYGDVMILVRTRTHMAAYEQALQAAGIPYVSDRRGGLLETPEVQDLCALLRFLSEPHDNLALAQILAAPFFAPVLTEAYGSTENGLNHLAMAVQAQRQHWWQALMQLASTLSQPVWQRIRAQLQDWLEHAGRLPVHDLLDRIYHQAALLARYTACVPAVRVAQVQANLREFLALALNLDGGRYSSVSRFLQEISLLRELSQQESPDEASLIGTEHAVVRLLTVHAAKGLEAPLVCLADATYQPKEGRPGLLFDWPPALNAPRQVSFITGAQGLGKRREALWQTEQALAQREAQNLLYVALTRAQQLVVVTGVPSKKNSGEASWYQQIQPHSQSLDTLNLALQSASTAGLAAGLKHSARDYDDFCPPAIADRCDPLAYITTPQHTQPSHDNEKISVAESAAQQLGTAWHGVLQRIRTHHHAEAILTTILPRYALPHGLRQQVRQAVKQVISAPTLAPFFSDAALRIETELSLLNEHGELKRLDRLVELHDAYWILDYKWAVSAANLADYQAQLQHYRASFAAVLSREPWRNPLQKPIRLGLITPEGRLIEVV
ncbi:UvrD-helicase domain-containing protein [Parvibium lacunae]|uniref:DNA 3'-5' helicase n=1 Tax=Parvibium lacunae TaxID=1888893 RepID=A0A368L3A5_9BURK|nr:UvrD-helicase domain-containing protein [Parvibium lacunae]RCS58076.1 hypothetical protein DU000_04350 [Parvibium lacunae]